MRALLLAALLVLPAAASSERCTPGTSDAVLDVAGHLYYVNDVCELSDPCLANWYVYAESNGISGLQRSDHLVDDTCGGAIASDTIVI